MRRQCIHAPLKRPDSRLAPRIRERRRRAAVALAIRIIIYAHPTRPKERRRVHRALYSPINEQLRMIKYLMYGSGSVITKQEQSR